jgi:LmbE family N-acetylglucosaminyl deacetylase
MTAPDGHRIVVVSPHCDDAVLSCGGRLATAVRRGYPIRVITICGGVPPGEARVSDWDLRCGFADARQAALARLDEDREACRRLGAELIQLPWLDVLYAAHMTGPGYAASDLVVALSARLDGDRDSTRERDSAEVWVPAGLSGHPDHVFARDAALRAARDLGVPARLYADAPFPGGRRERTRRDRDEALTRWRSTLAGVLACQIGTAHEHRLTRAEAADKMALIRCYASQMAALGGLAPTLSHVDGEGVTEVWWDIQQAG